MRVLIVGDFSSSGHFLASGFSSIGVDVTHVAYQNGWRKNPIQYNLTSKHGGLRGRLENYIKPFTLDNLKGYDAVIFIDYFSFPRTFGINSLISRRIQDNNKGNYLWVMGCDSKLRDWGRTDNFDLCNPCLMYDQKSLTCRHEKDKNAEEQFLKGIRGIIPATYEYHMAHRNDPRIGQMIQLPIINAEPIRKHDINEPVRIFHGLNRYGFKGTHVVEKVFRELASKYKTDVIFSIEGKMPFNEYTKLVAQQNIIVDQLFSQCLGINGLLTLAQGKVLIASDPKPTYQMLDFPNPPMIITEPFIMGLKNSIEMAIDQKSRFNDYQEQGIEFIRKYHAPDVVAAKFLSLFSGGK